MYYLVGLGNPGKEYETTRHNTGRLALADFVKNSMRKAHYESAHAKIIFPDTFMNQSGLALKPLIKSKKMAERLIVVHDDIDLPLARFKISFGSSSGGHKGVESVIRAVKTKDFIRIRVGTSASTPKGKVKKPVKVIDFLMGKFRPGELAIIKKLSKKITLAIETIIKEGLQKAMSLYNR